MLSIDVYRHNGLDCTNSGVSSHYDELLVVNAQGPGHLDLMRPPVLLEQHVPGCLRLVPAVRKDGKWVPAGGMFMMGGNYGSTSDSRFYELAERLLGHRFYGAVAIHDRQE